MRIIIAVSTVSMFLLVSASDDGGFENIEMKPEKKQMDNRLQRFTQHWSLADEWNLEQIIVWWDQLYRLYIREKTIEEKKDILSRLAHFMKSDITHKDHFEEMKTVIIQVINKQELISADKKLLKQHVDDNFILPTHPARERARSVISYWPSSKKKSPPKIRTSKSAIYPRSPVAMRKSPPLATPSCSPKLLEGLRPRILKQTSNTKKMLS